MDERKITIEEKLISDFIPKKSNSEDKFEYQYTIPKFQRHFVWDYNDIKSLWDSVYRNYPIGSFIIWESDKKLPNTRNIADNIIFTSTQSNTYKYILDGQQRITSLIVSILGGKNKPPGRKRAMNFTLYFSLERAKNESEQKDLEMKKNIQMFFTKKEVGKLSAEEKKYLIEVKKLTEFDPDVYSHFYDTGKKDIAKLYQKICNRLKTDYKLSIINLQNMPIEEVCELFTRVNRLGKRLSTIDLIIANTFHDDFYFREYIDKLFGENGELDRINYREIDALLLVRLISIIKNKSCKESDLFELTSDDFKNNWEKASDAFKEAIIFLRKMNITSSRILPYSPMLVPLSYFFYLMRKGEKQVSDNIANSIEKWFWIKSFNGDYQGATNEEIKNDCILFEKFLNEDTNFQFKLNRNFDEPTKDGAGESNIILSEKLNLSNGFCKSILCVMANARPKDFTNHNEIDIYDVLIKYKKSELHHIFPKKCQAVKPHSDELVNSMLNVCFLPKESNQNVLNDDPKDYFIKKVKEKNKHYAEDIESNLIPNDGKTGIWNNDFKKFLSDRYEIIYQRIKKLIA